MSSTEGGGGQGGWIKQEVKVEEAGWGVGVMEDWPQTEDFNHSEAKHIRAA